MLCHLYIAIKYTTEKIQHQQGLGFDEITNMERYMLCFRG